MRVKPAYLALIALSLFGVSQQALAIRCEYNRGQSRNYMAYNEHTYHVRMWQNYKQSVMVPSSAQVGDVIHRLTFNSFPDIESLAQSDRYTAGQYIALGNCRVGTQENFQMSNPIVAVHGGQGVYSTTSPLIGYRAYYPGHYQAGNRTQTATGKYNLLYFPRGTAIVEFVLLSTNWNVNNTIVAFSDYMAYTTVESGYRDQLLRYSLSGPVNFYPEPCRFYANKDVTIRLDDVNDQDFTSAWKKMKPKDFTMSVECNSASRPPKVRFVGTPDNSGYPGALKSDTGTAGQARNIAVLMEYKMANGGTAPIPLNSVGTDVPFHEGPSCGSNCRTWQLPLQASYFSTAATVTPGNVSAYAQVIVEYD